MPKKLKRIKRRSHAQKTCENKNSNDSEECAKKKLDWKIGSCPAIAAEAATLDAAAAHRQLFGLPNCLEKPQEEKPFNYGKNFNNQIKKTSCEENTNYQQQQQKIQLHFSSRNRLSRTTMPQKWSSTTRRLATSWPRPWPTTWRLLTLSIFLLAIQCDKVRSAAAASASSGLYESTTPLQPLPHSSENIANDDAKTTLTPSINNDDGPATSMTATIEHVEPTTGNWSAPSGFVDGDLNASTHNGKGTFNRSRSDSFDGGDSIFMRFARRFSTGNELWDGIIRDCYQHPSFVCFQNNVYTYLNGALDAGDVNVTQRFKFYKNSVDYMESQAEEAASMSPTEAAMADRDDSSEDQHLHRNEIPRETGRAATAPETPIEEVTSALYGKSIKFAMTHDIEIQLPEMLFDGSTFRISPRGFEGNGIIAKLELIPKQEIQARLAGKILMDKIKKFLRSKLLLSFLALLLIIKIIKIKLFWLLPIVIGVGAAKKLLLKFLLFLFPALSHLFKLCSYYQQTYHSTKYHHHHHLIDHHHTVVPAWHHEPHHPGPEIIYTNPPKGHPSAYLHGAPIHETYGPPGFEHNEGNWESSGPGLGSAFIGDIHREAQVEDNSNLFKPNTNDANVINAWGLGSPPSPEQSQTLLQHPEQQQIRQKFTHPQTQQHRPPSLFQQQQIQQQQQQQQQIQQLKLLHQKQLQQQPQKSQPHATSQSFNPFGANVEKQSVFSSKYKTPLQAQSAPRPVYTPPRNAAQHVPQHPAAGLAGATTMDGMNNGVSNFGSNAAQIAAQYEPTRHQQHPTQQQNQQPPLSPEVTAQLKEALRIQAEQRIVQQQQKILEQQPFASDGQPLYPKNYDPFYSPILLKIDKIVEQLGVTDDLCKERLVCSMYKDPNRYSPHSNFVSAELSRDTNELQPVTSTNPAVLRFYRLIQAARDGQDQRDCLRLYAQCNINTE